MAELLQSSASYTPILLLARGGMGEVEIALRKEGDFRRLYVIKRLREGFRDDKKIHDMFLAEARIAGLIRHSNVVSVLDVGEDSKGPFLIMDYIEGVSVSAFVRGHRESDKEVPLQIALRIGAEAARGLHAAHTLCSPDGTPFHVIHRDVSPPNILLGFDGITRLTDFGVAKALGHLANTEAGVLKGKFGYMSPEQLRFQPVDERSDIFSLGVVLYEMLAGRRLYAGEDGTPEPQRILEEPPPDIGEERSELPPEVAALFFKLLAKEPDLRPATAKDVAQTLDSMRVPMEADQGVHSLGDYLETNFWQRREMQLAAISEAMEKIEAQGRAAIVPAVDGPSEIATKNLQSESEASKTPSRSSGLVLWIVGLSVVALAAVILLAVIWMRPNQAAPDRSPIESRGGSSTTPVHSRGAESAHDASSVESTEPSSAEADVLVEETKVPRHTEAKGGRRGPRSGGKRATERTKTTDEPPAKTRPGSRFDLWPMSEKAPK